MTTASEAVDVVIVGGGPAGTSTALHLALVEGLRPERIVVVDKATFPRDKPCAGAISAAGVTALSDLGIGVTVPSVEMLGVRIVLGGKVGETREPIGVVVRRSEFDHDLLQRAARAGVRVREGQSLASIARVPGGFEVSTLGADGPSKIRARLLVAADGAAGASRRLLQLREPERKGHLYVLETDVLEADAGVRRGLVDFDLDVLEDGLEGYYWDFPTPIGGRLAVSRGIYHANLTPSRRVKEALGRALARRGVDLAATKPRPFATRPFVASSVTWLPGVVLVGEAAGIDRTTGEGIAQAIVMGKIAARHLMRALRTGGTAFDGYDREVRRSFVGRHMLQSAFLARHVYAARGRSARRLLLRSDHARVQALKWYRGESLPIAAQLRMAVGLALRL